VELGDTVQSSVTARQAGDEIKGTLEQLFAGGAVSVDRRTDDRFDTELIWGSDVEIGQPFSRASCGALRTGQPYRSDSPDEPCRHHVDANAVVSICVPMVAHDETIGVFRVYSYDPETALTLEARSNLTRLAQAVGEQLGLALANFRLRDSLREQSIRDPLTNLFNRRYMEETFVRELSRAAREHVEIGVMQIDIDHFKEFNDTYGHDMGDILLRAFANLLFAHFRDSDVPCRYGGEEFTLILINSSLDETEARARELQQSVLGLHLELGHGATAPAPPTLSIGVASYPAHGDSAERLIRAADQALYVAKSRGRDTIVRAVTADAEN
jgi:diguanylate cyclase (GGDEF)-like protein